MFDLASTRALEHIALEHAAPHCLMQRAGLAVARLCLAVAPHAQRIWIAAGPGSNGGDGLEAAARLQAQGKTVSVSWLGAPATASNDCAASYQHAIAAGVVFVDAPPTAFDLCVDALLGIGANRAPSGTMAAWIDHMNASGMPVVSIDIPSGLDADTGVAMTPCVRALACLCLLTIKPGLFTADGRDASGSVWVDDLQVDWSAKAFARAPSACAHLAAPAAWRAASYATHKGSRGDVVVVGGAPGMGGAAVLAGMAALHQGAGRVYLARLDGHASSSLGSYPELMPRDVEQIDFSRSTVVCGCGGGHRVVQHLAKILSTAPRLVLDADALNAVARDSGLQAQLRARRGRGWSTVLTPHPLEAARLLGVTTAGVQADRRQAAARMSLAASCTVVLKGAGSIVARPGQTSVIVPTGNPRLATAGTGDVLAGAIGAALANGLGEFQAACDSTYMHGQCADLWPGDVVLTAARLAIAPWRRTGTE